MAGLQRSNRLGLVPSTVAEEADSIHYHYHSCVVQPFLVAILLGVYLEQALSVALSVRYFFCQTVLILVTFLVLLNLEF